MRFLKFILLSLTIFVLVGCQTWGNHHTQTTETANQNAVIQHAEAPESPSQQVGYGIALKDKRFTDEWRYSLALDEGHFKPDALIVENFYPDDQTFRLHFFLNSKSVTVIHQGEQTPFIDLEVRGNSTKVLSFEMSDLERGVHDLLILLLREPNRFIQKDEFISPLESGLTRIAQLHVGGVDITPNLSYETVKANEVEIIDQVFLSAEPLTTYHGRHFITEITDRDQIDQLWLNFPVNEPDQTFSLMVLQDTELIKQVYLKADGTGLAHYRLNLNTLSTLDKSNLHIILAGNPYMIPETMEETYIGKKVYLNHRVTINIE